MLLYTSWKPDQKKIKYEISNINEYKAKPENPIILPLKKKSNKSRKNHLNQVKKLQKTSKIKRYLL